MKDEDRIRARIASARLGGQDALRKATDMMEAKGLTHAELAALSDAQVDEMLKSVTTRTGTPIKRRAKIARAMRKALIDLADEFPKDGFQKPASPVAKVEIPRLAGEAKPAPYDADKAAWRAMTAAQERGRETVPRQALLASSARQYDQDLDLALAAADALGVVDESFGVRALTHREIAGPVLDLVAAVYPDKGAGVASAMLRVATDLMSSDPTHVDHIRALRTEVRTRIPDGELREDQLREQCDRLRDAAFMGRLAAAPKEILKRAEEPGLKPIDRLTRASVAVAVKLKDGHPAWSIVEAASLDLAPILATERPVLLVADPKAPGKQRGEPITPEEMEIVAAREKLRVSAGVLSKMLFSARHGGARDAAGRRLPYSAANIVTTCISDELEMVLGVRVTFRDLKNLAAFRMVTRHPKKVDVIAETLGIRHPENLKRRMRALLMRRRK